jgi:hypothetical protein
MAARKAVKMLANPTIDGQANAAAAFPAKVGRGHPPVEHQFKPGNPGRPKGSRNKLGEHFIAALCADFEEHGTAVIAHVREGDPAVYLRVVAGLVPQHVLVHEARLDELSDDELAAYILAVRQALGLRENPDERADAPGGDKQAQPLPAVSEAEAVS